MSHSNDEPKVIPKKPMHPGPAPEPAKPNIPRKIPEPDKKEENPIEVPVRPTKEE